MKLFVVFSSLLLFCSCKSLKSIERNYRYAPDCDCYVKSYIVVSGRSVQREFRQKARCDKTNLEVLKVAYDQAESSIYDIKNNYYPDYPDSIAVALNKYQQLSDSIEQQWLKCKVRVHHKQTAKKTTEKRKVRYYSIGRFGYKKLGKTVFLNGSVVRTTINH